VTTNASIAATRSPVEPMPRSLGGDRYVLRLWVALGTLALALLANMFVTVRAVKAAILASAPNAPVASLGQNAWRVLLGSWQTVFGPADLAIGLVIGAALLYVVHAERKHAAATELLWRAERSNGVLFGLLTLLTLTIARLYASPGQVFMGDTETHLLRAWMFAEHFRHLDAPTWSNAWYGGFPLLAHYGPLYFIATALLTLATADIHVATKLLLWGCHVGSVFTMFWFLREATGRRLAALVGAIAFGLTFHRVHIILFQGDLQVAVVFLLLPVALSLSERFMRTRAHPRRTFVALALVLAATILNHHGYAFFALVFLGLYWIGRMAATREPLVQRARTVVVLGAAAGAALVMSAFLLVPFMLGMAEHRGMPNSAFPLLIPNPLGPIVLVKLFKWSALGDGGTIGYVGLSIGVMAVIGAAHGLRRRDPVVIGLTTAAVASLLMVHNRMSYNVKNIDFFTLFVSALSAWVIVAATAPGSRVWGAARGQARWGERFPARATAVAIGLLLLDLGLTTFQSPFRENYEFKEPVYEKLVALGPYKTLERQVLRHDPAQPPDAFFDRNKLGIPSSYVSVPSPLGFFHEGAGRSFAYSAEIVKQVHRDLNAGRLGHRSVEGLYVMGVRQVVFRDRYQWFTPALPESNDYSIRDGILRTAYATPLLVSTRVADAGGIAGLPDDAIVREGRYLEPETFDYSGRYYEQLVTPLLDRMQIDMTRGVAGELISRDARFHLDEAASGSEALRLRVTSYTADLKRVAVAYESNRGAAGQLPYTYFPYLRVTLDGAEVPFYRSAFNTILVQLPAGAHTVRIVGVAPPLQAAMLWLSLAALAVTLIVPGRLLSAVAGPPSSSAHTT
jgi:hypothetical protein